MGALTTKYLLEKLEHGAIAVAISLTDDDLVVELADGRAISTPLLYYPRLFHGTVAERENWQIEGEGIH